MKHEETIAAIATAPGEGGISVVRISGPAAFPIADNLFVCSGVPPSRRRHGTFAFGRIREKDCDLDEVLMLFMREPRSYTGEDTVEIHGHGGSQCARRILRATLNAGARLAEPGEFTKRAFLAGRIDLLQAEAVLDLIRARSERAAAAAVEQMEGALSGAFGALYDELLQVAASLEATLDFPEDELPRPYFNAIRDSLAKVQERTEGLLSTWEEGHLLRDGALAVISGKANVGKSTLLNKLLGHDRAIVSAIPGTTRDTIEESLVLQGIPIRLVDTAGLRETDCEVEQEGIRRTRVQMEQADLRLHVLDASQPAEAEDLVGLKQLDPRRTILMLNKVDLGRAVEIPADLSLPAVETSLVTGDGLDALKELMAKMLASHADLAARPHATISERHRTILLAALGDTRVAACLLAEGEEESLVPACAHLRSALELLGQATGRVYHDELLDSIFSKFCIGK